MVAENYTYKPTLTRYLPTLSYPIHSVKSDFSNFKKEVASILLNNPELMKKLGYSESSVKSIANK